jgi:HSP20 family protein
MIEKGTATQTALEPIEVKIVEPQTLVERLNKLSERISRRAYELFESNGSTFGHDLEDWFKAESEILQPFDLRIKEKNDSLTIEAQVPGFTVRDLEVSLEPWRLTISGQKETKEEQKSADATYQERSSEQLLRVIDLPSEIDSAKARATLKNGLLEITIPKSTKAAAATVQVKAA